jgi:hypothetical protein
MDEPRLRIVGGARLTCIAAHPYPKATNVLRLRKLDGGLIVLDNPPFFYPDFDPQQRLFNGAYFRRDPMHGPQDLDGPPGDQTLKITYWTPSAWFERKLQTPEVRIDDFKAREVLRPDGRPGATRAPQPPVAAPSPPVNSK